VIARCGSSKLTRIWSGPVDSTLAEAGWWRWRILTATRIGSRSSATEIRLLRCVCRRARVEIFVVADDNLASVSLDLEDVQRRAGGDTEPLALPNGEIVNGPYARR